MDMEEEEDVAGGSGSLLEVPVGPPLPPPFNCVKLDELRLGRSRKKSLREDMVNEE